MPAELKVELKKGIRVGGIVRDEHGKAVSGVRVALFGFGYSHSNFQMRHKEYAEFWSDLKFEPAAITDSNGRWEALNFPNDLEKVSISMMRPDGSVQNFTSQVPENLFDEQVGEQFNLGSFREGKESFVLKDGHTVRGVVLGPNGKPISGVPMKEAGRRNDPASAIVFGQGRFELRNRQRKQLCCWQFGGSRHGKQDC